MLKLHGFAVSNYFNMVRMALETKAIPYEAVLRYPSQEDDWLALSPMGKVPCLETAEGCLVETTVILDYLEDHFPDQPLMPRGAFEKAQTREVMQILQLYIELPARRLYSGVFFGGQNTAAVVDDVKPVLEKGIRALKRLSRFDPYIMGGTLTAADFMFLYTFELARVVARKEYDWDLVADIEGSQALIDLLNENASVERIAAENKAQMAAFLSRLK